MLFVALIVVVVVVVADDSDDEWNDNVYDSNTKRGCWMVGGFLLFVLLLKMSINISTECTKMN